MSDSASKVRDVGSRSRNRSISSERRATFTVPGLDNRQGAQVADALQRRLTSLVDLGLTLKHVHWNVVGPNFIAVHELLDTQYTAATLMVDELAERIATLGSVPSGLPGRVVAERTWDDYSLGRADALAHLGALDKVFDQIITDHRRAMDEVGEIDRVSEDLLIRQTSILEQQQWFIRSHLSDWAGGMANAGAGTELEAARSVAAKQSKSRRSRAIDT